jgi:prepilin-type N-terminal cleavage/methylation domain-containing protein
MKNQNGFTLVEVMIALVILAVVMLGVAGTTGAVLLQAAEDERETTAVQLVHDRIEVVLTDPDYDDLVDKYAGAENDLPGAPDMTRVTTITPMTVPGEGAIDAKKVSVKVTGDGLGKPVSRTAVRGQGN